MLDTSTAVFSDCVVMDGFLSITPWLTYLPAFIFLGLQPHMFSTYIQYLCLHTDLIVVETYLLHKLSCLPAAPPACENCDIVEDTFGGLLEFEVWPASQ